MLERSIRASLCRYGCRALVGELLAVQRSRYSPRVLWACVQIIFETVQVEELAGKLCKPAASLLLPATLAAALWSGAQNCSDVEAVRNTQLVSVDTFDSSRNAHLLTLHLPRCTHRFLHACVDMVRADRENESHGHPSI